MSQQDVMNLVSVIMTTVNLFSNMILLLITLCSKHLRSTCNRLIALEALIVVMGKAYQYIFLFNPLWPVPIAFTQCIWILFFQVILLEIQLMMPLMIALERLFNVLYPVWAWKRTSRWYTLIMFLPAFIFGVAQTAYYVIVVYIEFPNQQVECNSSQLYYSNVAKYTNFKNYAVIGACWAIYLIIWIVLRLLKTASSEAHAETSFRRLTHSLLVIISLITIGWAIPPAAAAVISRLSSNTGAADQKMLFALDLSTRIVFYLTTALVCPTLCLTSNEYRKALSENVNICAGFLCFCCCKKQQLQQQQQLQGAADAAVRNNTRGPRIFDVVQRQRQQQQGDASVTAGGFNHNTNAHVVSFNNNSRIQPALSSSLQPTPTLPNSVFNN